MPKFAANLTMLFNEVPFLDRFEAAAKNGFKAVEFLFPYAYPTQEIKARLDAHHLSLVLHNLPAGNWDSGERGIGCLPDRVDEFRAGVKQAIEVATQLGAPQLNCLAGKAPAGVSHELLRKTFVENLRYAAAELKKAQATPMNFINKFLDENGLMKDAAGYHRALAIAMNPDKFAKFFYEQGKADATDSELRKIKNINMSERRAPEAVNKGGMQVRSVTPDSGKSLKIRSIKKIN